MNESNNLLAWPTSAGYVTVRPLSSMSSANIWLIRRDSDQNFMVLKLTSDAENICSLRQTQVEGARKYVVDFYGTISTQLGEGLLMEYCPGGSLGQLIAERSTFSLGECITALAPIAQTLSTLHQNGQRHGDVSVNNILLTAQGMPKLGDFQDSGLGKSKSDGVGTPGFIAPESSRTQWEHRLGERDVYALGACLWFLLEGKVPPDPSMRPPVRVIFPALPELIHDLLLESLHEDPAQRPTAEQFARTLFASAPAEPINWVHHTPSVSTHLMATVHPDNAGRSKGRVKKVRQSHVAPMDKSPQSSWNKPKLRHTPGRYRIMAVSASGALVVILSIMGVNIFGDVFSNVGESETSTDGQADCRIQDGAVVPACAWSTDTVVSSLIELTAARDQAISKHDLKALKNLYPATSEQLQRDEQTLKKLGELGLTMDGLETRLEEISVVARSEPDAVLLSALSTQGEYAYLDGKRQVVHKVSQGEQERIEIELRRVKSQWKIGKVISRGN